MNFQGIQRGDMVIFRDRSRKELKSKVNPLLIFPKHVVVNRGKCGTVVDESNFVRVQKAKISL